MVALSVALLVTAPRSAQAGGGPETTVVVVNGESPASLRVANDYVRRRRIPASHVCVLDGVPTLAIVDVDTFRARLWGPVKAFLERERLLDDVDCVAWSADFPYGVDFAADKQVGGQPPLTPIASLTSMTYLWRRVEAKDADGYLSLQVNAYYRRDAREGRATREPTEEEAAARSDALTYLVDKKWDKAAEAYERLLRTWTEDPESRYNYACCLARLGRHDDAVKALEAAVAAGFDQATHASEDADLEPLRGRPDFQALLARMRAASDVLVQPARGFSSRWAWTGAVDPVREPAAGSKDRYLLSTSLAYTGPFGNSVPEALSSLAAAIGSDGTNPDGTFYFLVNDDVRARTREPRFEGAVSALRAMGRKAQVLRKGEADQTGVLPVCKTDVLGAVIGSAGFDWDKCQSRILPGAICEHLTSFGAMFNNAGQTKLSELIRHGAAGASGTVNEPYAIQAKFPVPHLHVHYATGCSLAEAFYQSVWGPYQLLVVGDPLARPFASFGRVALDLPKGTVAGTVSLTPSVQPAEGRPVALVELWVDGRPVARGRPGEALAWDTTASDDGPVEVRAVAVEDSPVGTRSFAAGTVSVANGKVAVTVSGAKRIGHDDALVLVGKAPGAKEVVVRAGARDLAKATVKGDGWKATVPARALGLGTVVLHARATRASGPAVRSPSLEVVVVPPALAKAVKSAAKTAGWQVEATGGPAPATFTIEDFGGPGKPGAGKAFTEKAKGAKAFLVTGEVTVKEDGLYQFVVNAAGEVEIEVDGRRALPATKAAADRQVYGLAALAKGPHAVKVRYEPSGTPDLTILLAGDVVAAPLTGRH
jgi:tetratricopeptide (TPR) repeat protein